MKQKSIDHFMPVKQILGIVLAFMIASGSFISADIPVCAASTKNLLKNPGAETGNLSGWVDSTKKKCWMVGYEGNIKGWAHPAAHKGKFYFMTGWPGEVETKQYLYQDVDISKYIGGTLEYRAYLGGYGHADKGGLKLEILDKNGKVISSKMTKLYEVSWGDWSKHLSLSLTIPKGAKKARVYMVGALHQGDEADAYFDDLTLIAYTKTPDKGVVSKISNVSGAKAKITVKKVSGATKYQIRYKVGSSKTWTTKSSSKNTFTVSVKKGAKITVQSRVKNKSGWGNYGSSKSFTTDKK